MKHASATRHGSEPARQEQPHGGAPADDASHRGDAGNQEHQRQERAYWIVTGAASVAATVAAVVAASYAVGAYNATLDSLTETRKQVTAAREANEISRRTLAAAVGASVHVGHTEFRQLTHVGDETKINVIVPIGNDGGTTTRGLTYSAACAVSVTPSINPFSHKVLDEKPVRNLTLPPKETVKPLLCSYTIQEWAYVGATKASIFVYGRASYRDTVEPTERHTLEFCNRLDEVTYTASAFNPGPFAIGYECERHNCADDECEARP